MNSDMFKISLEAADGSYIVQVDAMDNNGTMQYIVNVLEDNTGPFQPDRYVWLEQDSGEWRQAPESVERGPKLPGFLVEEIGEAIENPFK